MYFALDRIIGELTEGSSHGLAHELRIGDTPRLPAAGPGRPDRRRPDRRPATARRGRPRGAPAVELHPDLDGRRAQPLRDVRPQARRTEGDPRRVLADRDRGARSLLFRADEAAGVDRRQAGDRAIDLPQPGEPWRGQPLHDDRRPDPDPGRLRRVRQLPPQPGLGHRARARVDRRDAPVFLDAQHVAVGRAELPGGEVCPVRGPR